MASSCVRRKGRFTSVFFSGPMKNMKCKEFVCMFSQKNFQDSLNTNFVAEACTGTCSRVWLQCAARLNAERCAACAADSCEGDESQVGAPVSLRRRGADQTDRGPKPVGEYTLPLLPVGPG